MDLTTQGRAPVHSTARAVREGQGDEPRPPTSGRRIRVPIGRLFVTPGALEALHRAERLVAPDAAHTAGLAPLAARYLVRHMTGDWGDLDADDRAANDRALANGERILSAYELATGERIWIITEADRSMTSVILPQEY